MLCALHGDVHRNKRSHNGPKYPLCDHCGISARNALHWSYSAWRVTPNKVSVHVENALTEPPYQIFDLKKKRPMISDVQCRDSHHLNLNLKDKWFRKQGEYQESASWGQMQVDSESVWYNSTRKDTSTELTENLQDLMTFPLPKKYKKRIDPIHFSTGLHSTDGTVSDPIMISASGQFHNSPNAAISSVN